MSIPRMFIVTLVLAILGGLSYLSSWQAKVEKESQYKAAAETWNVVKADLIYPEQLDPIKALDLSNRLSEHKKMILAFGIADNDEITLANLRLRAAHIAQLFDTGKVVEAMKQCRLFKISPALPLSLCRHTTATMAVDSLDSLIQRATLNKAHFPELSNMFSREVILLSNIRQAFTGNYPVFDDPPAVN